MDMGVFVNHQLCHILHCGNHYFQHVPCILSMFIRCLLCARHLFQRFQRFKNKQNKAPALTEPVASETDDKQVTRYMIVSGSDECHEQKESRISVQRRMRKRAFASVVVRKGFFEMTFAQRSELRGNETLAQRRSGKSPKQRRQQVGRPGRKGVSQLFGGT